MVATRRRFAPLTPRTFALFKARRGTTEQKFWPRFERGSGCWLWLGSKSSWGYGILKSEGRMWSAHRLSWEFHYGPIPAGLQVCHHCDVRDCVRPDHLFLGTQRDNVADMDAKGRRGRGWTSARRGEGHAAAKLTDAQVASIRVEIARGEAHRAIARRFDISHTYVGMLARGDRRVA